MKTEPVPVSRPWWRHGYVWLVISGPAVVAVAAVITTWLAVSGADPVVDADYYRRGIEINKRLAAGERPRLPALQGRNHAATPAR
ncbi:MAG TPA: FixH family protein [Ramlibacter sp.]|jgi:hypothetical protein